MSTTPETTPEAPKNLYQRISAVMQDVKRLRKDKAVGSGSYAYQAMSEEKVATTLRTAMIEHGLVIFPVEQQHTMVDYRRPGKNGDGVISISTVDVKYKLVNIDNPSEFEIIASAGTGVDPQDKGVGKAMTYSMKYALMRAFLIPTGEDPDDVHNEDLARQQQAAVEVAALHLSGAIKAMGGAVDMDALKVLWRQHSAAYGTNMEFVATKDARKLELEKAA
jgi:hypothetical protein